MENEKVGADEHREDGPDSGDDDASNLSAEYRRKEALLVKKLDVFIAPVVLLLMLISYLDRG